MNIFFLDYDVKKCAEWKNHDIPYWFEEELVLVMD